MTTADYLIDSVLVLVVLLRIHEQKLTTWASAFFWLLGVGSRFAFVFSLTHSGAWSIAHFSAQHSISPERPGPSACRPWR